MRYDEIMKQKELDRLATYIDFNRPENQAITSVEAYIESLLMEDDEWVCVREVLIEDWLCGKIDIDKSFFYNFSMIFIMPAVFCYGVWWVLNHFEVGSWGLLFWGWSFYCFIAQIYRFFPDLLNKKHVKVVNHNGFKYYYVNHVGLKKILAEVRAQK